MDLEPVRNELRWIALGIAGLCAVQFLELAHRVWSSLMVHHLINGSG